MKRLRLGYVGAGFMAQKVHLPNVSSIEECERLRARETFLENQQNDLIAAKTDLLQVIAELDEAAQAAQLEQEIAKSVQMARSLAQGLILVGDGPESLMYWLGNLAASLEQLFSVRCRFICPEPVAIADSLTATHLYHICQEAAHNAIRHGGAKNISLRLENAEDAVILSVEDDGAGLPREAPLAEGMGLKVMKYRCDAIGASFSIGPATAGGAVVTCRLPHAYDPAEEGTP